MSCLSLLQKVKPSSAPKEVDVPNTSIKLNEEPILSPPLTTPQEEELLEVDTSRPVTNIGASLHGTSFDSTESALPIYHVKSQ